MTPGKRRLRSFVILLVLLLLAAGHYLYWYAARERPGAPEPGGLPARLIASEAYDACLWAPYPHQNVAVLATAVSDGSAYLAAVSRMAELPPPVLPSFGPFALPPSKEIAACSDLDGGRFLAVAHVYPVLAVVARLAGKVAGNPWLAGGEVRQAEGQEGGLVERVIRIAWRDGLWTVSVGDEPDLGKIAERPFQPGLGIVRLKQDVSQFPAGLYRLHRLEDGDLELGLDEPAQGGGPGPEIPDPLAGEAQAPVLLAVTGPSWPPEEARPLPPAALALFDTGEGAAFELPGSAVFNPPDRQRWRLPGQGIAGLLKHLPKGNAAGWQIVAVDRPSLRRARGLAPRLAQMAPPDGSETAAGRLVLGLWFHPRPTLRLVSRVRAILQQVPLVDRRQVRRWRDAETLLAPLSSCERVALTATESPPSFRLRFHGCGKKP